ncbi:hypothetical protein KYC5002_18620 [Archangium violaceum]|uniref:hypothetical protein n=1 Tax=Archangium violaceum TaxID=83451 RepID=UPI002B2F89B6|nr:hypothetical protein KYC5002_18620 [Archangium gephyra]
MTTLPMTVLAGLLLSTPLAVPPSAPAKPAPAPAPAPAADPWAAWAPLLGRWVADAKTQPDGSSGWFTLDRDVQGHVLVRKNHAAYPAAHGRPAGVHDDLMVIYPEGKKIRADYWDNEGHVIHYEVSFPEPSKVVFLSDATPGAPRFRLTYAWTGATPAEVALTFEIAPPNAPDTFKPYITSKVRRDGAAPK